MRRAIWSSTSCGPGTGAWVSSASDGIVEPCLSCVYRFGTAMRELLRVSPSACCAHTTASRESVSSTGIVERPQLQSLFGAFLAIAASCPSARRTSRHRPLPRPRGPADPALHPRQAEADQAAGGAEAGHHPPRRHPRPRPQRPPQALRRGVAGGCAGALGRSLGLKSRCRLRNRTTLRRGLCWRDYGIRPCFGSRMSSLPFDRRHVKHLDVRQVTAIGATLQARRCTDNRVQA